MNLHSLHVLEVKGTSRYHPISLFSCLGKRIRENGAELAYAKVGPASENLRGFIRGNEHSPRSSHSLE